MISNFLKKSLVFMLALIMVVSVMPVQVIAAEGGEVTPRALGDSKIGVTVTKTSNAGDFSYEESGTDITVFADSKALSQAKVSVKITNKKSSSVVLSFAYTLSAQSDKASLSGAVSAKSGVYREVLAAGASITINVDTGANNRDAYLYITNISAKEIASGAANINFVYNTAYGSVSGAGTAGQKVTVTATAKSGSKFLAWTDENGMIFSKNASFSFLASGNDTLKAIFANANGEAYFEAGNFIHSDLNKAAAAATKVILAADGILAAGDYTIPAGVTLLIPKDTAYTVNTTMPDRMDKEAYAPVTPTAFRTLKMAEGASITVNGAISVAGTQHAGGSNDEVMGGVYGPVGFIRMDTGSKITVNNGAFLYAWGYIVGSGEIDVLSGGTVYESFQSTDWRGGTATTALVTDETNSVFPMSQYYVQNIEVPTKLYAGATEKGYTCTTITLAGVQGAEIPFIGAGDDNLFTIDSGYVIKDYDEATDRQTYKVYGNISMKKIKISMKLSVLATYTVDSSKYVLPITNNLSIEVFSGTIYITQDLCFLPGAEIIIHEGATGNVADGKSIYVYDVSDWGNFIGSMNSTFRPLPYAPGRTFNRTSLSDAKIQIDGTVNASSGFLYTTAGGAIVTSTGNGRVIMKAGTATKTYQLTQNNTDTARVDIPVVVAKLQNKDGTTTNPAKEINPAEGTIYTYSDGKWVAKCRNNACVANGTATCADPLPCIYCGLMLGHTYTTTVKEPVKCLTAGKYAYTCSCGYSYEEAIPATGHRATTDKAVAPSCTGIGKTEGSHCSVCSEVLAAQKDIPATGHTFTVTLAEEATCSKKGNQEYKYCAVCKKYFAADAKADATNGAADNSAFVIAINAEAHKWDNGKITTPATCKVKGVKTYTCQNNSAHKKTEDLGLDASKHVSTKNVAEVKATCTKKGTTAGVFCNDCQQYVSGHTEIAINPSNHVNTKTVAEVKATCTTKGTTAGTYCNDCQKYVSGHTEIAIDSNAHKWDNGTITTTATCKVSGIKTYKCQNDASHIKTENLGVNASNHVNTKTTEAVAPTCTTKGYTAGVYCNDCQKYISGHTEIAVDTNAHKWDNGAITTTSTCKVSGVKTYTCQHNSAHKKTENLGLNASNHANTKNVAEVKATCTTKGYTAGVYCNDCQKYISGHAEIAINPSNHVNTKNVAETPATFDKVGYTAGVYCNDCQKYISGHEEIPVLMVLGDVDGDGSITSSDARLALRVAVGLENLNDSQKKPADVDGDGQITASDARLILRAAVGLEDPKSWKK